MDRGERLSHESPERFGDTQRGDTRCDETAHANDLLCALYQLQNDKIVCDFIVKVDDLEIPTHRAVLVACSDYFKGMFMSNMREVQDGSVMLQDVNPNSIELCIKFIYSGKANINSENVKDLLHAANLLQLSKLVEKCFLRLGDDLNVENCIFTLKLAEMYDCAKLILQACYVFKLQFAAVTTTDSFLTLEKGDALSYIKEHGRDDEMKWEASKHWMMHCTEERRGHVVDFAKVLDFVEFPRSSFLTSIWTDPIFRDTAECMELLYQRVFRNVLDFGENLILDNCFTLKEMIDTYEHVVEEVQSIFFAFLLKNFPAVTSDAKFTALPEDDVIALFQSPLTFYVSSEKIKWYAALKWVKKNQNERESVFPILMETIALDELPIDFLNDQVRAESLVQNSPQCRDIILDAILKGQIEKKCNVFLAVLDHNGSIDAFDILEKKWCPMHYNAKSVQVSMTSLNGNLCILDGKELHFAKNDKWMSNTTETMKSEPGISAQIVTLEDRIYVIEERSASYYDSISGSWSGLISLNNCVPAKFCAVASNEKIYLFYSEIFSPAKSVESNVFIPVKIPLTLPIKITQNTNAVFFHDKVYLHCTVTQPTQKPLLFSYNPKGGVWTEVPFNACNNFNTKMAASASQKKLGNANREHARLVAVSDKLLLISSNDDGDLVVEGYDDVWNEWMQVHNISQVKSQGIKKCMKSVCCFSTKK